MNIFRYVSLVSLDVARARGLYPALGSGAARLDAARNPLMPEAVIRAVTATLRAGVAAPGDTFPAAIRGARLVDAAKVAVAGLVGGPAGGARAEDVVLGTDVAALTARLARQLSARWQIGDHIVLCSLDRDDLIAIWTDAAKAAGVGVRYAEVDVETCELPEWQYEELITSHTSVVVLPAASAVIGTLPNVRAIAERARGFGALVVVDASAAATHTPVTFEALGADAILLSGGLLGGPSVAALALRSAGTDGLGGSGGTSRDVFRRVRPRPVATDRSLQTAIPYELLGGLVAAIDHLVALTEDGDEPPSSATRDRVTAISTALDEIAKHERYRFDRLLERLRTVPGVVALTSAQYGVPVALVCVRGQTGTEVATRLAEAGVAVGIPSDYGRLLRSLGVDEAGGGVTVAIAPYTSERDIDRLVAALRQRVS